MLLLAPFAPHIAEELWHALGHTTTLAYEPWPTFDPALAKADEIEVPVQVNGKLKARLTVPAEIDDAALEAAALADETVKGQIAGKTDQEGEGRAAEAGECGGGIGFGERRGVSPTCCRLPTSGLRLDARQELLQFAVPGSAPPVSYRAPAAGTRRATSAVATSAFTAFQTDTFPPASNRTNSGDKRVSTVSDTARTARNATPFAAQTSADRGRFHVHRVGACEVLARRSFSAGSLTR